MVEWKKLGDIASVSNGERPISEILDTGLYPYINAGRTNSGYLNECNSKSGAVTTPSHGEGGIGSVLFQYHDFWCGALCYKMYTYDGVINRFLYHYLCNNTEKIINCKNVGGQPYINRKQLENIIIGIPYLSEQTRIVGILDTFTASIENLKQQIAERRKQYEHYRDQLLDLEGKDGVEMKKVGDFAKVLRGKRLTKNLLDKNAPYPVFHGGIEPLGRYGQYNRDANTVMVINVGASAGTVGFCDSKFWSSDGCFCISHSEIMNDKYLYYYMETKTHYLQSQVRHAGIPTLDNPVVEKVLVPILSLQEQQRIVSILDTFEASIQNLKEQIKLREKQYEYYRNKLLTFD